MMELANLLSKIEKLGFKEAKFYLNVENEDGDLFVRQISAENEPLISSLAADDMLDYHKMYMDSSDMTYFITFP